VRAAPGFDTGTVSTYSGPMRNVTLTVEDELLRWARVRAAQEDKSVSRFLADLLKRERDQTAAYEEAYQRFQARRRHDQAVSDGRPYPTRDELYDRPGLR
jgi:hypothetical protein